jgi:hypothetical protein
MTFTMSLLRSRNEKKVRTGRSRVEAVPQRGQQTRSGIIAATVPSSRVRIIAGKT